MEKVEGREFTFQKSDFRYISSMIYDQAGIVLADQKFDMMYARLARRLRHLKLTSVKDYIDFFNSPAGADELPNLVNAMTTNLTRFFREAHHFETLQDECLEPARHEMASGQRDSLRIWSAGCSSGMEPYSIAMTVAEGLPSYEKQDVLILATDIDTSMLDKARQGLYPKKDMADVPPAIRKKYTARAEGDMLRIDPRLKSIIRFKKLNLLHQWPFNGPFDVIFCRNVLIYFDKETRETLVSRFTQMLSPGGILFLGHSEALAGEKMNLKNIGRSSFRKPIS